MASEQFMMINLRAHCAVKQKNRLSGRFVSCVLTASEKPGLCVWLGLLNLLAVEVGHR
jgi:hypothetical protein